MTTSRKYLGSTMADFTSAQINVFKEKDLCSPMALMAIYTQLKNTGRDGLILSIARAMENKIEKQDRLQGVDLVMFKSLMQEALKIENDFTISLLERRIQENRGSTETVAQPSTSTVAQPSTSGVPKPAAKRTYNRRKPVAEKKRKDVSVERQPAKKSRPALKKAPISKSIVSGDDSDSENEFDPPKQAKKTASTSNEKEQTRPKERSKLSLSHGRETTQVANTESTNAGPPPVEDANERAVNSIVQLSGSGDQSQTDETQRAVDNIPQPSPVPGPSGVQPQKDPGQQKWNPSEEPDDQRRQFLSGMDEQSKRLSKLKAAKKSLFVDATPKVRPVPQSSVPEHQLLDSEEDALPSPERLPITDVEEEYSPLQSTLSPMIRRAQDLREKLAKKNEQLRMLEEKLEHCAEEEDIVELEEQLKQCAEEDLAETVQIGGGRKLFDVVNVVEKEVPKFKSNANFLLEGTLNATVQVIDVPRGLGKLRRAMRGEFLTWYAEQQDIEYDFAKELEEYCTSDSMLLMQACEKFRATMLKIGNINSFSESVTIAGMCNLVFRRNFLPKDTIAIIPNNGYRWKDLQSLIAIKFLLAEELRLGIEIQHSGRAGEFVTPTGHLVDGYAILDGKPTVWEYQGCYFHYCKDCYSRTNVPLKDDPHSTMNFRREMTINKIKTLKQFGYNVIEMYDCKFRAQLAANPHLLSYVNNHPLTQNEPLVPRDALYGGRTEGMQKYYKCTENEKIHFADIISLYPKILRDFKVPVGVPKLHLGPEFPSLLETEGLVKCLILPPRRLFHPVLPIKMHSKLMFVLCRKCAKQHIYENCPHNDPRDRALGGTWVIDEVRLAIKHGYNVLEIYEIWEYEVRVTDKANSDGVFFDYVNTFLKIKQQASGWPEWCVDEETKERYIQNYKETEGIELDRNEIEYNPGLRYIAKLCLNTTWGYLCKNTYKSQTTIVNEPKKLFAALENPNFDVTNLRVFGEKAVLLNYDIFSDVVPPDPKVNVTVACYVTCGARMMLYEHLDKLKERVFYVDTDSVCYLQRPGEDMLQLGEQLGALSNELKSYGGEGTHIDEICVAGAKNYAMKIVDGDKNLLTTVCKVKGITLNFRASQKVNFDVMKDMILYEGDGEPTVEVDIPHKIFRNKYLDVITKPTSKKYRTVHDKRKTYDDSYICYPFGYILD
ncbi:hypothetical protein B566_EDAN008132 [Ephemera danica]|nr:hypothetical protein B566_EDAN008132 [Ephemera danica]